MSSGSSEDVLHLEFVHVVPEHETELRSRLYQLWRDNLCCDLTVSLKGGELRAHSCVLAAFSPKLKTIVEALSPESEAMHRKCLHLTFEAKVFECLLNVMYSGVLSFNTAMLSSVLSTARWLQMDEIVKLCQEYKEKITRHSSSESKTAEDSVLTEVNSEDMKEETATFHPTGEHDKLPEAKSSSPVQNRRRKRGRPSKAGSLSLRGSQRKSRNDNTSSPVRVKVEPETEPGPETELGPHINFSDPVNVIPERVTKKACLPKQTSQRPKQKKREPGKPKQRPAKEQKTKAASPVFTEVKTENVSPEESLDSSFSDPNIMSNIEWAQGVDSQGKDETDFAMGKTDHIRCKKCLMKFTDLDKYFSHITDHPSFKCDHCDVAYNRLSNLTRHMRTSHSTEHHLKCKKCDFVAGTETVLRNHFKEVHGGDKPFICDQPGCTYSSWKFDFLRRHSEIHSELKRYMCTKCGQGFAQHAGLVSHERTCYHLQQFLCDVCGQAFNHVQSMRAHRRTIHFGEKPYACTVCGNQFSDQRNLKRHLRIHENSFPYQCPVCQQNYRHSNSLKAHLKKHDKDGLNISDLIKESFQKTKGANQSEKVTLTGNAISQHSDNCGNFAGGSQSEMALLVGSGESDHSLTGMVFSEQTISTSTPQRIDGSSATTAVSSSGVGSCSGSAHSHAVGGGKDLRGSTDVLQQLSLDGKTSDSPTAVCISELEVADVMMSPFLPQTSDGFSQPEAENFLITSSLESSLGRLVDPVTSANASTTVIKVELLNAGSSSQVVKAVDKFAQSENIVGKDLDRQQPGEDTQLKGQSSYGLQTLAEICFSSSV